MITEFKLFESEIINKSKTPESVFEKNSNTKSLDGIPLTLKDVEIIFDADPTKNKSYVVWLIVKLFANSERTLFYEDLYKATRYLTIYHKIKHKIDNDRDKNIFNIDSLPELYNIIEPFETNIETTLSQSQRQNPTLLPEEIKSKLSSEIVYEDEEWQIIIPLSQESSCVLGEGTQWCTAHEGGSLYSSYANNGPLYIFRMKRINPDSTTSYIPIFQLHLHGGNENIKTPQFMDVSDKPENPTNFFKEFPKLRKELIDFWKIKGDKYLKTKTNPISVVLNSRNKEWWTDMFHMIIESGFDINYIPENSTDSAILNSASMLDTHSISLLLEHGADVTLKSKNGESSIMRAIQSENVNANDTTVKIVCELLKNSGADASGKNNDGYSSVLIEAFIREYYDTFMLLLNMDGYDPNALESPYGKNILSFLINLKSNLSIKQLDLILNILLDRGLNINSIVGSRNLNRTALHILAIISEINDDAVAIAELLLQKGADPWIQDNSSAFSNDNKNYYPIELPIGREKNPKMVELLTIWMKKLNPNAEIPTV